MLWTEVICILYPKIATIHLYFMDTFLSRSFCPSSYQKKKCLPAIELPALIPCRLRISPSKLGIKHLNQGRNKKALPFEKRLCFATHQCVLMLAYFESKLYRLVGNFTRGARYLVGNHIFRFPIRFNKA